MTAVATILNDGAENAWLVPSSALIEFEGQQYVRLVRDGQQPGRIAVTPGTSQGEWTVVQSEELQAGDKVVGQVASFVDQEEGQFGPGRGGGPFGPPPR